MIKSMNQEISKKKKNNIKLILTINLDCSLQSISLISQNNKNFISWIKIFAVQIKWENGDHSQVCQHLFGKLYFGAGGRGCLLTASLKLLVSWTVR